MEEKPPCCQPHVVIGLDVGTTYSGACIVEAINCLTHGRHEILGFHVINKFKSIVAVSLDNNGPKARFLGPHDTQHEDEEIQRFFKFDLFYESNQSAEDTRLVTWVRENHGHEKKKVGTHDAFKTFLEGLFVLAFEKCKNRGVPITTAITYPWKLSRSNLSIIQHIVNHSAIPNQCSKVIYGSETEAALAGTFQLFGTRGPIQTSHTSSISCPNCPVSVSRVFGFYLASADNPEGASDHR
ncbi:unnamed protein product [Clonostachys rosea f. rosea IK726]|uniref:Uncharacterized protein n=1 Tax=Clonostachys rosea f. rosea IK726 TaxID=1349383 RepID=A0ACA9TA17_BIOOC|nr:unnamed protein product [Clonostachys rosea f. rosea IK726]